MPTGMNQMMMMMMMVLTDHDGGGDGNGGWLIIKPPPGFFANTVKKNIFYDNSQHCKYWLITIVMAMMIILMVDDIDANDYNDYSKWNWQVFQGSTAKRRKNVFACNDWEWYLIDTACYVQQKYCMCANALR